MNPKMAAPAWNRPAALFLLLFFAAQAGWVIGHTAPTTDEIPFHMVSGYTYLAANDYRMNPTSSAFIREWLALPWLALKPKLDLTKKSWQDADSHLFAVDFFYKDNKAIADLLLYTARGMALLMGLGLGWLLFLWADRAYGPPGGLAALALYVFLPNFLAHSAIAGTDLGAAFFVVAASFALWSYLEKGGSARFILFSVSIGFALASKNNMMFLWAAMLLAASLKKGAKWFFWAGTVSALIAFTVIWTSYRFEFKPLLWEGVPRVDEKLRMIDGISRKFFGGHEAFFRHLALTLPIPAPSYALIFGGRLHDHFAAPYQFAFGVWGSSHPWFYYPFLFFAKMTIPFLFFLGLRTVLLFKDKNFMRSDNLMVYPYWAYLGAMLFEHTGRGTRYLLPLYAMVAFWSAQAVVRLWRQGRAGRMVAGLGLGLHVAACLGSFPNFLSYFNEGVGGSRAGMRYSRESDVDWGQDLKPLAAYLKKEGIPEVALHYFGTAEPSFYGIHSREVEEAEKKAPRKAVYAISVRYLEQESWAAGRKPDAIVGTSIYVYDFR